MLVEEMCSFVLRQNISPESTSNQQNFFLASPHSALEQTVIEVTQTQISILAGDHRRSSFSLSNMKAVHESDEDLWKSRGSQWGGMGREQSEVLA